MLYIIGAGGHARVIVEAAQQKGWKTRFIKEAAAEGTPDLTETQFLAKAADFLAEDQGLICGIGSVGSTKIRQTVIARYQDHAHRFLTLAHPSAVIAMDAKLGRGVYLAQGTQIVTGVHIGDHAIINTAAILDHDTQVGVGSHIGPGATLCGAVHCGQWVHVGSGSVVIQGCRIADGVILGAGTVVTRDILEPNSTWVGAPARRIR